MMATLSGYNKYYHEDSVVLLPDAIKGKMIAYWNLDEGDLETRLDSHGNAYLEDNNGGTPWPPYNDPVFGQVVDFGGTASQNLKRTASEVRQLPYNSDFCVAGWVNFDSLATGSWQAVIGRSDNGANTNTTIDWHVYLDDTNDWLAMYAYVGASVYSAATAVISASTWYFVYAYYNATDNEVGISLDLGTINTGAVTGDMSTGGDQFKMGRRSFNVGWEAYFNGKMTRWGAYNGKLTQQELAYLYNSRKGRKYAEIV